MANDRYLARIVVVNVLLCLNFAAPLENVCFLSRLLNR
jgi:hypothetical protein